jgi:putative hydrolase of the HAD superfamily
VNEDRFAPNVSVIGFDGDDTLWHSEDAFARAQDQLVELLAAYGPGTDVLARLREVEHRNRDLFGYGVKGFMLCMIETAIEVTGGQIPATDIEGLLETGREMLARPVELLAGVAGTLPLLAERYRLALITKGDLLHQDTKIARSGLAELFETVDVLSEKTSDSYLRILRRLRIEPEQFLMVGNSEVSDVWPVVALGGWSVLVPYPLTSLHESGLSTRPSSPRLRTVTRIDELPALLSGSSGTDA